MEGSFASPEPGDTLVGMAVGAVYRLQVTEIPNNPGVEIYPTIELVDRLYPPPGLALRFPIPVELTLDELELAAQGRFVTRVIYVEDPNQAVPVQRRDDEAQPWLEAGPGDDPLVVADGLGRPVAILRIGGRVPSLNGSDRTFSYGSPPLVPYGSGLTDDGGFGRQILGTRPRAEVKTGPSTIQR
jgi:hypothetical protein